MPSIATRVTRIEREVERMEDPSTIPIGIVIRRFSPTTPEEFARLNAEADRRLAEFKSSAIGSVRYVADLRGKDWRDDWSGQRIEL
jgi:hypothetical protein